MTVYLDTSLIVAALTREKESSGARAWLVSQPFRTLLISDWVITEFSSALSVKLRTRQITPESRAGALRLFGRYVSETFETVAVSRRDFHMAATYADHYSLGLRAGDALHLAIASSHGAALCTLDKRLIRAASDLGIAVQPIPSVT